MASVGRVDTRFEAGSAGVRDTQRHAHIGNWRRSSPGRRRPLSGLRGLRRTEGGIVEIGDAIIAIDGIPIENEGDLFPSIESLEQGDTVTGGPTGGPPEVEAGDVGSPEIKLKERSRFEEKLIASNDSTFLKQ